MKETKCDGIKLEGGRNINEIVKHLIKHKIPVMGHIGITPQSVRGKFRYKGKSDIEKKVKKVSEKDFRRSCFYLANIKGLLDLTREINQLPKILIST